MQNGEWRKTILAKKVLIVDNEFLIRWSLAEALSEEGYEVKSVEDGKRALEVLEGESFDFVLTDLMMPGADGWEVLERVKETCPKAHVVIITAYGTQNTEALAKKRGAFGYVEKPEIIDKVKRLLENSRSHGSVREMNESSSHAEGRLRPNSINHGK